MLDLGPYHWHALWERGRRKGATQFTFSQVCWQLPNLPQHTRRGKVALLAVNEFSKCVTNVDAWLSANRLRLNASKLSWCGSAQLGITCSDVPVLSACVVILNAHVISGLSPTASGARHCRLLSRLQPPLSTVVRSTTVCHCTKTLVQAFISCRLDYCNSLLYGINDGAFRCIQLAQNAAARLVTGARRCDHISPLLRQLMHVQVSGGSCASH